MFLPRAAEAEKLNWGEVFIPDSLRTSDITGGGTHTHIFLPLWQGSTSPMMSELQFVGVAEKIQAEEHRSKKYWWHKMEKTRGGVD